jgi:hypothetical protein
MQAYGGVNVWIHIFVTSALVGGEWSASRTYRFSLREEPPHSHCTGGWVDLRAGLDEVEKRQYLNLQVRSQSLNQLSWEQVPADICLEK